MRLMRKILWKSLGTIGAVMACAYYLPGVHTVGWEQAAAVGVLLAVAYLLFRPVARILLGVFSIMTLGLMGIVIDAALFMACAGYIEGLTVDNFGWALGCAVIVNAARMVFGLFGKMSRA